ncbi:MAG: hypothetical protein HFF62_15300 [Oscillospiraceae bacterium]|jgi:hypothetical protein|nr:hypothetical protein [Oscillospiraceae bacterium]
MYGPVNVPGAAGVDLEEITNAVKTAQSAAAEAKRLVEELQKSITDGTIEIKTKAAFPVVAADPENPEQGDAWILTGQS